MPNFNSLKLFVFLKFTPKTKYAKRTFAKKKSDFYNQWLHKHTFKGGKEITSSILMFWSLRA